MTAEAPLSTLHRHALIPRMHRPDPWLLLTTTLIAGVGLVMVFNASYFHASERFGDPYLFFTKHLFALALGTGVFWVASRVHPHWWANNAYLLLSVTFFLVICVLIPGIGLDRGGARRWLPLGIMNFQPSEFVKITAVLFLARFMSHQQARMQKFWRGLLPPLLVIGFCTVVIGAQPDLGTAIILILLLGVMLYAGGARLLHLVLLTLPVILAVGAAIYFEPFRVNRIIAFLDPFAYRQGIGFQLVQSLLAFGSGGLDGIGLGASRQKMFFLPEAHTDFIFALIGEEFGALGGIAIVTLFAVIAWRGLRIAARHPDPFSSLLALGLTVTILLEVFINVAVVTGLLPTKGLALPLISYGGSALIGAMAQIGVLAALSRMVG